MKREEAMKNLWTKSDGGAMALLIHTARLSSGHFAPIWKRCQRFDPIRQFRFIPLRGLSY